MDMNPELRQLFREQRLRRDQVSTGMQLLDRAFQIPLRATTLLKGEAYSGCTAVALEIAAALTKAGVPVIYVDTGEALFPYRLHGIDPSLMAIVKPLGIENLLDVVRHFHDLKGKAWIVDNIDALTQWKNDLLPMSGDLGKMFRRGDPSATVIGTQSKRTVDSGWDQVVQVRLKRREYRDRNPIGHTAEIKGPIGESQIYIEYGTGRISKAYEHAILQYEAGTPVSGIFTDGEVTARGIRNFVREANSRLIPSED